MDEVRKTVVEVEERKARSGDCTAQRPLPLSGDPGRPWQPPDMGRSGVPAAI
jgi:hypothetical protein